MREYARLLRLHGIPVTSDFKIERSELEKAKKILASRLIQDPKQEDYFTKNGRYSFEFALEEDYSQKFLEDTKNLSEDDAFDYYDGGDYIDYTQESLTDIAWNAVRTKLGEASPESIDVQFKEFSPSRMLTDEEWTREAAAEALKKFKMVLIVHFEYGLQVETRTKIDNAVSEAIKEATEA